MTERSARWSVVVLVLVMVGLAGWLVANSPIFAIGEVRVLGNVHLTAERVRALAEVNLGDNILRLETDRAESGLEEHARVAGASVTRDLPSTVVIRIDERRPAAWVRDPRGPVVVATDGVVLDRIRRPDRSVPYAGRWPKVLGPGGRIGSTASLQVATAFPPELRPRVREIRLDQGRVEVSLRGGLEVRYGPPVDLAAKHRALVTLLGWASDRGVEPAVIDLRFPTSPTVLPSRAGS
jgi:cell division protein FtsQ